MNSELLVVGEKYYTTIAANFAFKPFTKYCDIGDEVTLISFNYHMAMVGNKKGLQFPIRCEYLSNVEPIIASLPSNKLDEARKPISDIQKQPDNKAEPPSTVSSKSKPPTAKPMTLFG